MAYRLLGLTLLLAASVAACASDGTSDPFTGEGGQGGDVGIGGAGGSGTGGTAGTGGTIDPRIECETSALCLACPAEAALCDTDFDCSVGFNCIDSGCSFEDGGAVGVCTFAGGGFCESEDDCSADRDCLEVPNEGMRCIKTTPGCGSDLDCVPGFACEDGNCFDRRVPCILDGDCPKNHFCNRNDATGFCERVNQDCVNEFDCAGIAPRCADVDGDGNDECAGVFNPNAVPAVACTNSMCGGSTPICEIGGDGASASCGEYGLCTASEQCAPGFECVQLWLDGRSECVETGGSCSHISDCPERTVCASARTGGAPECQVGYQP